MTHSGARPLPSFPITRALARIGQGSSFAMLVRTPAGRFACKWRGAAQGTGALVAEVLVAELAETLGLPVPERAVLELHAPIESDDRNDELLDLLGRSLGDNLGLRWLDDASTISAASAERLDDEFAVRVAWLDGLVMNPDRTRANPNVLLSRGQPWLIDQGAALPFQYDWSRVSEDSPRAATSYETHLFASRARQLAARDAELAALLPRAVLEACVSRVPDAFLTDRRARWSPDRARAALVAFLWKRLKPPRPFIPVTPS